MTDTPPPDRLNPREVRRMLRKLAKATSRGKPWNVDKHTYPAGTADERNKASLAAWHEEQAKRKAEKS